MPGRARRFPSCRRRRSPSGSSRSSCPSCPSCPSCRRRERILLRSRLLRRFHLDGPSSRRWLEYLRTPTHSVKCTAASLATSRSSVDVKSYSATDSAGHAPARLPRVIAPPDRRGLTESGRSRREGIGRRVQPRRQAGCPRGKRVSGPYDRYGHHLRHRQHAGGDAGRLTQLHARMLRRSWPRALAVRHRTIAHRYARCHSRHGNTLGNEPQDYGDHDRDGTQATPHAGLDAPRPFRCQSGRNAAGRLLESRSPSPMKELVAGSSLEQCINMPKKLSPGGAAAAASPSTAGADRINSPTRSAGPSCQGSRRGP
jgi:hypothetical protein